MIFVEMLTANCVWVYRLNRFLFNRFDLAWAMGVKFDEISVVDRSLNRVKLFELSKSLAATFRVPPGQTRFRYHTA